MRLWRPILIFGMVLLSLLSAGTGAAEERDASVDATSDAEAVVTDPRVTQIRELIAGTLEVGIEPGALFDVDVTDEGAVQADAVRLRALLRTVEQSEQKRPPAPAASLRVEIERLDPQVWGARLELERQRLAYFELTPEERAAILEQHHARQVAARPVESERDRRLRLAEEERRRVLDAASAARSELERVAGEEQARLVGLEQEVAMVRESQVLKEEQLAARREALLGWQKRVQDAQDSASADALYDALCADLQTIRDEFTLALDAQLTPASMVPEIGANPLETLPRSPLTESAFAQRQKVLTAIADAKANEEQLRQQLLAALADAMNVENRLRLSLLPRLSPQAYGAVTGFSATGWRQAKAESQHLALVLRYHGVNSRAWFRSVREDPSALPYWQIAIVALPWTIALALFGALRRRLPGILQMAERRARERALRSGAPSTFELRLYRFVRGVYRSVTMLAFYTFSVWLLPSAVRAVLEVDMVVITLGWMLGGWVAVDTIHALAGANRVVRRSADPIPELRLRSLRLVGWVVVCIALMLVLSARVVGEGTLFRWTLSTCWVIAIPVFLLLVRWWREVVFTRLDRRRNTALQQWILANRRGYKSFFAAMIGAATLFLLGTYRVLRRWLTTFNLARRAHAYLFRRGLTKLSETAQLVPLTPEKMRVLSPYHHGAEWVSCPADAALGELLQCARNGGLLALVGQRGLGKSTLLERLARELGADAARLDLSELRRPDASLPKVVLVDDAHHLCRPVPGGIEEFLRALAELRKQARGRAWVLAFDAILWPVALHAQLSPLFDRVITLEPWSDVEIGTLLEQRSEEAGLALSFDALLQLPPNADEIERQDALEAHREGYFRMIWDHSYGVPGLALEAWRASLSAAGESAARVLPLQVPDTTLLDGLPDQAAFVLRAILQMGPTSADEIARAVRQNTEQVESTIEVGRTTGYLQRDEHGAVNVSGPWLRSVLQLLISRHLVVP